MGWQMHLQYFNRSSWMNIFLIISGNLSKAFTWIHFQANCVPSKMFITNNKPFFLTYSTLDCFLFDYCVVLLCMQTHTLYATHFKCLLLLLLSILGYRLSSDGVCINYQRVNLTEEHKRNNYLSSPMHQPIAFY